MHIEALAIPDVKLITPAKHGDTRGFFSETWNFERFREAGLPVQFVQDNHAMSADTGTVRGLHYQLPPHAQGKLVRVVHGSILDVAVDIRRGSPTFGQHVKAVLSAKNWAQLWVPFGFAHGYATLEPDTEVIYKVTDYYSPAQDRGIAWDDPALGIDWGLTRATAKLSAKDERQPVLAAQADLF
jgi:dTDP-4-dehydrorhamnose 3,5-epimerase